MMREAAYMAGLTSNGPVIKKFTPIGDEIRRPQEINPNKLFLALEPEVAAIFAQFKNASSTAKSTQKTEPPKRYMVVDIGGGTVDITVHDIKDGKIDVVLPPNGNMWGGFKVNEAFEKMLGEVVDDEGFSKYQKKHPDESVSTINNLIYMEVENQKKKLGNAKDLDKSFVIKLPDSFVKCYGKNTITKQFKKMPKFEFEQNHGNLRIEYIEAKEKFLKDTIGKIVEIILNSFQRYNEKVEVIYLVGGFGSCAMMQNEIKKAIENSKGHRFDEIICPHTPNLAVVKGAVIWRQDPSVIHSRRANATYGLEVAPIFDESKHDKDYQFKDEDGNLRCHHVFQVFIEEGEPAKTDEVLVSTICPPSQGDTQMFIPLYSSSRPGIQYTRDIKDGRYIVEQIGQLIIDIPNDSGKPRVERLVEVSMSFSGAEIRAKAKYTVTGEEVNVVCDFLSQRPKDNINKKYSETAV
jgi:ankyrin